MASPDPFGHSFVGLIAARAVTAGVARIRLVANRRGRGVLRRHPRRRLRLDVTARDAAGNVTSTRGRRGR